MRCFALRSRLYSKLQQQGPKITLKPQRRLQFQIPILMLLLTLGFIWTFVHGLVYGPGDDNFPHSPTDDVVQSPAVESFDDVVWPRQLETAMCDGQCKTSDDVLMEKSLDDEFIMVHGSAMLKYRDPYECDEVLIPSDDDSDDEDCIFEMGNGRRRRCREDARKQAALLGRTVCIQDDKFERQDSRCHRVGIKEVCIAGGAGNQISRGAQPIIKASKMGWAFWYTFCIFYMFIALAIVCDEFFVPALECFVDEFGISMDVAGATFMAAGGSMPELFTSVIATFKESEVGFVAIVGSAVFNVLFVIAVCAIFAKEVLELTWWPLFRDCSFYVIALLTVAFVFAVSSKNEIEWWEAVLLLAEYAVYCLFMKFNSNIQKWIERLRRTKGEVENVDDTECVNADQDRNINFMRPSTFRTGILQLLTKNAYHHEIAGISAVTKIRGDLKETFRKLDKDNDGRIRPEELKELFELLGVEKGSVQIKTVIRRISRNGDEFITFENFKRWYISSEIRIEAEVGRVFQKFDKNLDGKLELEEVKQALEALGHKPTDQEVQTVMRDIKDAHNTNTGDKENVNMITFAEFEAWYQSSMFYEAKQERNEQEEEEEGEGGFDLSMPEDPTWCNMIWYVITYPVCAVLFCTLPDVRTEKYQRNWKWAVVAFLLSLVWIGIFSNWLYECLVVMSNTLRIPMAVSAVTLLAGGTSAPDLISSYVVARNGQGDMAVSSSIGSNIFDVTVGLPLPWLIYTFAYGKPFSLGPQGSKGLGFSIILLVVMLAAVVGTIMCMKWRMTKGLGVAMLMFYVLYVVQYLLQKLPARCNADETGVFQPVF